MSGVNTTIKLNDGVSDKAKRMSSALGGVTGAFKSIVGAYLSFQGVMKAASFASDVLAASNAQIEAETKLSTVMQKRMGATEAQIASVRKLAAAQQKVGVIGDEVQIAGAQQLATFMNNTDALNALIPAMNNLAAQQKGVNATSQDMVGIGNLMGKVMQGQTSALTRVGITFTDAQEKILKTGNEMERAAMLAQVIEDNVGKMNEALANTPEGKMQQMKNAWSDMKEKIGAGITPAVMGLMNAIQQNMPQIQQFLEGAGIMLSWAIGVLTDAVGIVVSFGQAVVDNWSTIGPILGLVAGAFVAYKVAIIASAAAQWVYNAALAACPIVWVVGLIMLLVFALYKGVEAWNANHEAALSATGLIGGYIGILTSNIFNHLAFWYNYFANVANFIGNVFKSPTAAIQVLFYDMVNNVIRMLATLAGAVESVLNAIPNVEVDLHSGLSAFAAQIEAKSQSVKDANGLKDTFQKLEFKDYKQAATEGYQKGAALENKFGELKDAFSGGLEKFKAGGGGGVGGAALDDLDSIADSTGKTANAVEDTTEQLAWMKDIAEREIIDRTVFSSINVNMGGINNTVNNMQDLDGIPGYLANAIQQQMAVSAEGSFA